MAPNDRAAESWGFAGYVRHPISKPTIAAVNGFALGGGTERALASDLVVAAESATFGLPEVRRGLFAAAGGARWDWVNHVVPNAEVVSEALALAEKIAASAPLSVRANGRHWALWTVRSRRKTARGTARWRMRAG